MTTSELGEIVLDGCAPVPLAGYLKALGVLRLVAEQADPEARGFWQNERFVLKTRLARDEVCRFLLNEYKPSPVISPWNGGSGFYFQERKTKEKDPVTGKYIKSGVRDQATEATESLDALLTSTAKRFDAYRRAVAKAREILAARKLQSAPGDEAKADLIRELRSDIPDEALGWIDAAAVVTVRATKAGQQLDIAFPPLLGSGGNDGNLDFSKILIQTLLSLTDPETGEATAEAATPLQSALFGDSMRSKTASPISQYAPAAIEAPNSSTGFMGKSTANPWDVVLSLEGTLTLSAAVACRIGTPGRSEGSFPFMITRRGAFGAGAGNIDAFDEQTVRGEFWAPIWERPIEYNELLALFREGRAIVERRIVGNALDFARAVGQLGVDRGIKCFERYAFEQRYGNMYLGVPVARHSVPRHTYPDLIAELARGGWLDRVRSALRGKSSAAGLASLARHLDESLFRLAADCSPDATQEALIAIGDVASAISRRPKLREIVPSPPRLSESWFSAADPKDGSHELELAAAVASIDATSSAEGIFRLPFRRHLAPLDVRADAQGWDRDAWDNSTGSQALAVWSGRGLLRDMVAVMESRLSEAERRRFLDEREQPPSKELPLRGWRTAPLSCVTAFLARRTDDDRIAALISGLAWVRIPTRKFGGAEREDVLPFAYAALKPLFEPRGVGSDDENRKVSNPLPLVRLVRAGRIHEAVLIAHRLVRGAGLSVPFSSLADSCAADPVRFAASLLFPIAPVANRHLIARAYPSSKGTKEESDAA